MTLDDIFVHRRTFDENLFNLRKAFQKVKTSGLRLKSRVCELLKAEIKHLSYITKQSKMQVVSEKKKNPLEADGFQSLELA